LKREIKEETGLEVGKILGYVNHFDFFKNRISIRQFNFVVEAKR